MKVWKRGRGTVMKLKTKTEVGAILWQMPIKTNREIKIDENTTNEFSLTLEGRNNSLKGLENKTNENERNITKTKRKLSSLRKINVTKEIRQKNND